MFHVKYSKNKKGEYIQWPDLSLRVPHIASLLLHVKHYSPVLFPQPMPLDSTTLSGRPIIRGSLPSLVCRGCRPRICCPSAGAMYWWVSICFCTTAANIMQNQCWHLELKLTESDIKNNNVSNMWRIVYCFFLHSFFLSFFLKETVINMGTWYIITMRL